MLKQGVHWRVDRAVDVAVWRAVDEPLSGDVVWAVDWAVFRPTYWSVRDVTDAEVWNTADAEHPALQDFLRFASAGVV